MDGLYFVIMYIGYWKSSECVIINMLESENLNKK